MCCRKTILFAFVLALAFSATRAEAQDASTASPPPAPQVQSQSPANSKPAQDPEANNLSSTATPLRSTSRLVQLSVVVRDKQGNPISGLTKDDFVVLDDKRPQPIQIVSVQTN